VRALPSRRAAWTALSGLLLSLAVVGGSVGAAQAAEIVVPSADGSFAIEGHGWGHGRGMSQYGAQGAASLSKTADQITGFYYPGTAKAVLPSANIRVLLQADEGTDLQVLPASGMVVTDTATGAKATLPTGPARWRITIDSAGQHIASLTGSTWTPYALGGKTAFAGPVRFGAPLVRVLFPDGTSREYRTAVQAAKRTPTQIYSVAVMPLDQYLFGVVPRESSASWQAAALQAQAIAARSYSAWKRDNAPKAQVFDICDTTQCQVFGGTNHYSKSGTKTALEYTSTNDAVRATAGVVRTYGGKTIFAEFSASNGGWSTDGDFPYLKAQRDDWDGVTGSSVHSWSAKLTAAQVEARFPAVGKLVRMRVTARDGNGEWGGRVKQVVLEGVDSSGAATSVTTTGAGVYHANSWPGSADGLRSSWWHVKPALGGVVVAKSGVPSLVQSPGVSRGQLAVQLKNTGTDPWPVSLIHLTQAGSPGQADPLVGGSTRPGAFSKNVTTPGASAVEVGEVAEFRFHLDGDGVSPGKQARSYRLRLGSGAVFGPVVSWTVPVAAAVFRGRAGKAVPVPGPADPAPVADAPPAVFADGYTVVVPVDGATTARLSVTNTGNVAWPAGGAVRLGTSNARNRTSPSAGSDWVSASRPAALAGSAAVAPGGTGAFDVVLHGNGRPAGRTYEAFEPVWDGEHWIDGAPKALAVVRVDRRVPRLAEVASAPATVSLRNHPDGTATLRVQLRNLGGTAWQVGTEGLTSGSASPFATSAWSSTSRPPALAANASRPGVSTVHPGEVGEWRVPVSAFKVAAGSYTLKLRPVGPSGTYGPTATTKVTVTKAVLAGKVVAVRPKVVLHRDGTARTWFDVKNTGNVSWKVGYRVRSASLTSKGSPSRHSSWLSALRPGPILQNLTVPGATAVAPGQTARFLVVLAGNGRAPQTRTEPFSVVWEGWAGTGLRINLSYQIT
jgi:SpoIID/LytB domain protein